MPLQSLPNRCKKFAGFRDMDFPKSMVFRIVLNPPPLENFYIKNHLLNKIKTIDLKCYFRENPCR